jgi:hypothetical protein
LCAWTSAVAGGKPDAALKPIWLHVRDDALLFDGPDIFDDLPVHRDKFVAQNPSGDFVQKLLNIARRLSWIWALALAVIAAFIYRGGYEEIAAIVWLSSLIIVLPMWTSSG